MVVINFPEPDFRIKKVGKKEFIFDALRKKWLSFTPEEWVRQNFIRYLVASLHYPKSLIALEKEIQLGELKKRFDILVYDKQHRPWMLVECKGSGVTLDEKTFQQVLRYHISVPCTFLVITNGKQTFGWEKSGTELHELSGMPDWK